jgi:hypothetical protein
MKRGVIPSIAQATEEGLTVEDLKHYFKCYLELFERHQGLKLSRS